MVRRITALIGLSVSLAGCSLAHGQFAWRVSAQLGRLGAKRPPTHQDEAAVATVRQLLAGERTIQFDVYQPTHGPSKAAVLAIPGVAVQGKDDPRLAAFASLLSKNGFTVCIPELVRVKTLRVGPRDIRDIAESFRAMAQELFPEGRAGMIAFSYSAGPALLAALEPDTRQQVQFLLLVGGYYDLERLLRFTTTGVHEYRGRRERLASHEYGKLVFLLAMDDLLEPLDRQLFAEMVRLKLDDPAAELDPLAHGLGPLGKNLYELLMNTDPDQVSALIGRLSPQMRQRLLALSPSGHDLSQLSAKIYLIHGRYDPAIPYTESLYLRDALKGNVPVRMTILETLHHVEPGAARTWHPFGRLFDGWRLWWMMYRLARERG